MKHLLPLLSVLALAACGGPGGSAPSLPTAAPSVAPSASVSPGATAPPTIAPTASPSPSPTPTIVPLSKHIAAAPAQVFTAQGLVRRAQSVNLGNGQIPTVVGATSPYFGSIFTSLFVWAATTQNAPVQEASLQMVPENAVSGPISIASIGQDNGNAFALTYFDWSVAFNINKVGKGNVIATFGDGTSGSVPVYIYDQWYVTCASVISATSPWKWAYLGGVPTGQVLPSQPSDMTVDCTGLTVTFPNGATPIAAPVADSWGNVASALTTITAGTTAAAPLTIPVASLKLGTIYIAKLNDGGFAKIMPLVNDGFAVQPNISGISLHDSPSGSGNFPF